MHYASDVSVTWLFRFVHANGARFFFYMYLSTYSSRYLLWFLHYIPRLACRLLHFTSDYSYCFSRLCTTVGSNIFLRCNCYYKSLFYYPVRWFRYCFWLWGGFSVDNATLTRFFFAFHFLLPFIIGAISVLHLFFLHERGSGNPLGINRDFDKVKFDPLFL